MQNNVIPLPNIKNTIDSNNNSLNLNEGTLGQDSFNFLQQSFYQQKDFYLTNCNILKNGDEYLTFSGIFALLFPWSNVSVEFTLFDYPTSETAKQRYSVFRINIPDGYSASTYLSQYNLEQGSPESAEILIFNPSLENIIQTIDFSPAAMIFSSVDYSIMGSENLYYPDSLTALLPANLVKKGINFTATISFDNDLSQYLTEIFNGNYADVSTSQGLIYPDEYGPYFQFRRTTDIVQTIGSLSLEMKGISFVVPLTQENDSGLRVLLDGTVKIKDTSFKITADFNVCYQELQLAFEEFPSLQRLITSADINGLETYFPEPLDRLLTIQLANLGMVLNLNDKSVSEVSFGLTTQNPLDLIPQIISVKPSLEIQMYAPFEEQFREIEGDLTGIWQLGKTNFETTLYYPSYSFHAGMTEGQSLDMDALIERILPGIWLPKIQLTKMEVWGNFLSKSFSAEIAVSGNSTWGFKLAGRDFSLQSISMAMAYANQQVVNLTMDGTLILADVHVFISAEYDSDQGWMLLGGTAVEDTINVSSILNDLLKGISLPHNLPDLKLKNIIFSAVPNTGEYSLSAQTAEDWQLMDKLSLKVEQFTVKKSKNVSVYGTLRVVMTIDQTKVRLSAEKAASQAGGWTLTGKLDPYDGQVNLTKLVEQFMGIAKSPPLVPDVILNSLFISVETATSSYTFEGEVEIDWSHQKAVGDFPIPKFTATVNIQSTLETQPVSLSPGLEEASSTQRVYTGFFEGDVEFEKDLILVVRYDFVPQNQSLILKFDGYTCSIKKKEISPGVSETIVDVNFGDLSLGKLLTYIVNKVDPEANFQLDSPWDILNDLNLRNVTLEVNVTQGTGGLWYDLSQDFGFVDIQAIGIFYQKPGEGQEKSVDFKITGNFLASSYTKDKPLQWDLLNESAPAVPGKGSTALDLRFLGVGQHIAFKDTTEFTKVYDVLNKLGDAYKAVDMSQGTQKKLAESPNSDGLAQTNGQPTTGTPLDPLDALQFDPNSGWLIGADLTVIDAVTIGAIFNDPELYGLYIALSGPKVKSFAGLSFQILYKKINDHLGEYFLELKLPDVMRHLEFGEVSITIPIIDISIYTNGNFKLDFGFPYNNDFSNSFSIQAFPFEGAGGFYFAMLNGETSNHVPVISNGQFDPVFEFGLGLQIGVGKDINEGVFAAGIDITVVGILQGVIAVFNPDSTALSHENYYLIQGAIAIVGKLYGKIDFAIIKIDISVTLYASVQIVIESYQPIYITLNAGVDVRAFVQIAFIKIDFHFSATVTQKFTIGQASTPPWNVVKPAQPLFRETRPLLTFATNRAIATPTERSFRESRELSVHSSPSRPIPAFAVERSLSLAVAVSEKWLWSPNFAYNDSSNKQVTLYFVPGITAATASDNTVAAQIVNLLFIQNSFTENKDTNSLSDFDKLAQTLLAWALQAYLNASDAAALNNTNISEDDLNFIDKYLSGVVTEAILAGLLQIALADATVIWNSLVAQNVLASNGAILDANKSFILDSPYNQYQAAIATLLKSWDTPFSSDALMGYLQTNFTFNIQEQSSNPNSINASIFPMFKSLKLDYKPQTGTEYSVDFSQSIKDAFGDDYLPALKTYLQIISSGEASLEQDGTINSNESLAEVVFRDYFALLIKTAVQNAYRLLRGFPYPINDNDTLNLIATHHGQTNLMEMALANQNQPGILNEQGYAIIQQFTHQITLEETNFAQVAHNLSNTQSTVDLTALATSNLYTSNLMAAGQSLTLPSVSYTAPQSDTTLNSLAQQFYTSAEQIIILGGQPTTETTTNIDSSPIPPLTTVLISGIHYNYQHANGNLKSLTQVANYFGVPEPRLRDLNPDFDPSIDSLLNIPPVNYIVPPTAAADVATYFGVSADQVHQNGSQYTITNAQYTIRSGDSLFSIARYFSVLPSATLSIKPEDIVSANAATKALLQVGSFVIVNNYKYAIANSDTLTTIAQNYHCALADLIAWNKDNNQLLKPKQIWVIPSAKVKVSELMQTLAQQPDAPNFNNIAGSVSRFLLHGMSVPTAKQDFTQPTATWQLQSLYTAIGQQFPCSTQPQQEDTITLSVSSSSPVIQLPSVSTFKLTSNQISFIQDLPSVVNQLNAGPVEKFMPFIRVSTHYTLQHSLKWNSLDHDIPFQSQQGSQPVAGTPTIWMLPDTLQTQLGQLDVGKKLALNLKMGSHSVQETDMETADVNYYAWGTLIDFTVRQYTSSDANGQTISNVYELQRVEHDSVELLSRLLNDQENDLTLYLLYSVGSSGNDVSLKSDILSVSDRQNIQLLKTNLAGIGEEDPQLAAAAISDPLNFLRLLYESSDVQSGGYYLYYQTQQQPDGLPVTVFSQTVDATLTLLVLSKDTDAVASDRNCVVTRTAIDTSQMVFFAEAPEIPTARPTITPGNVGFEWSLPRPDTKPKVNEVVVLDISGQLQPDPQGIQLKPDQTNVTKTIETNLVQGKKAVKFTVPQNLYQGYVNALFYVVANFAHNGDLKQANFIRFQVMAADATSVGKVIKTRNGPTAPRNPVTLTNEWQLVEQPITSSEIITDPNQTSAFILNVNSEWNPNPSEEFSFYVSIESGDLAYIQKDTTGGERAAFESLFQMLGYSVHDNADFAKSLWAVPIGPTLPHDAAKIPIGQTPDDDLHYSHIISLPQLKSAPSTGDTNSFIPSTTNSPYRGINKTIKYIELDFNLQDVYGNRLTNLFNSPLSIPIQYYDPVISLSQWNGVAASYTVTPNTSESAKPIVNVLMDFNVLKYMPTLDKPLPDCLKQALSDLESYTSIYYQLSQDDVTVSVETSLGSIETLSHKDEVVHFIQQIYAFLATLPAGINPVTHTTTTDTLAHLQEIYLVSATDIALANATIPQFFAQGSLNIPTFYTVQFKDTLASIVSGHQPSPNSGSPYSAVTVASLNQDLQGLLRPGATMQIANGKTYVIKVNDTFASIARQYSTDQVTVESLAQLNANQDILASGAHMALFVQQTTPETGSSLAELASDCPGYATVAEFVRFNTSVPISNSLTLQIPNALTLNNNLPTGASIYTITDGAHVTLSSIAVNTDHIRDVFNANLYLLNIIKSNVKFSIILAIQNDDGSLGEYIAEYTTQENDTLFSIYTAVISQCSRANSTPLTTQAQFANLIKDVALLKQASLLMPPVPLTLSSAIQPENPTAIFPVTVNFKIARAPELVNNQLINSKEGQQLPTQAYQSVLQAETAIAAHTEVDENNIMSLQTFAANFEAAFDHKLKVAASKDSQDGTKKIWAVLMGTNGQDGIAYNVSDASPQFFAPTPLANKLISRQNVSIQDYRQDVGLQAANTMNFASVDLDVWGRRFLVAVDNFLRAQYAVSAYHLDPDSFETVVAAKKTIANAIASSVTNILETDDSAINQRQQAAQQALHEQLLTNLSSAYTVDAIVQYQTQTKSQYTQAEIAPALLGKINAANYTILPSGNNLQAILSVYQKPNPGITVEYLAVVLQDVVGIFDPHQKITIPNQPEYTPTSNDTLATVAQHFNLKIATFAKAIAQQNVLLVGKTLSLNWVIYPDRPVLEAAANYFEVSLGDIIFANLTTPNLIRAGQNLGKYTTQANDTFLNIVEGLDLSLDNLSTLSPSDLPTTLTNNPNLFTSNAVIGVLQLHGNNQPDFSLSTAEFSLYNSDSSWLNFLFTQSGQKSNRIFLDLDYTVNSLVLHPDGQKVPLYLTFIIPLAPIQMGQTEIPIPLRTYPTAPVLIGQNGVPFDEQSTSIEAAKKWTYTYTYQQHDEAQDKIEASVSFNVRNNEITQQTTPSQITNQSISNASDLFDALARFIHAYDGIQADLALLPILTQKESSQAAANTVKIAVQAFANLAEQVATNWETWHELQGQLQTDTAVSFSCLITEYIDSNTDQLNITVKRLTSSLPGAYTLPLVIADSDKWVPQNNQPSQEGDTAIYTFTDKDKSQIDRGYRQLKFQGLNILSEQNAWGGIALTRNQDLVTDATTNPAFIYQTPAIRFANRFTPLLTHVNKIIVAQPDNQKPLVQHLSNLFSSLLELTTLSPTSDLHNIKVCCEYAFQATGAADDDTMLVRVPVLLQPKFIFQLRDAMVNDPAGSQDSFVKRLADELQVWQQTNYPNTHNQSGTFIFEVTLFSNVDSPTIQEKLLNFLVTNNNLYRRYFVAPTKMPLSFYAEDNYWTTPPNNQEDLYSIEAITERLIVHYGADIYDVSTMQIALSLYPDFYEGMRLARAWTRRLKNDQSGFLGNIRGWTHQITYYDDQGKVHKETVFVYGGFPVGSQTPQGTYIMLENPPQDQPNPDNQPANSPKAEKNQPGAYYFRSISDQYLLTDPFTGFNTYPDGVTMDGIPQLHWTDWKPITGENAWACLLGPLHTEYNFHNNNIPAYNSEGVQLALNVLPAFKAMRSPDGGIYYAPQGTAANEAGQSVDPLQLSNENNFSSFAGLTMLLEMLFVMNVTDTKNQVSIGANLQDVTTIAKGIKNYFKKCLYNEHSGFFFTQGTYNNPTNEFVGGTQLFALDNQHLNDFKNTNRESISDAFAQNAYNLSAQFILEYPQPQPKQGAKWVLYDPETMQTFFVLTDGTETSNLSVYGEAFAVDVHTWGMAVLGVENIDTWFGTGAKKYTVDGQEHDLTAYALWQRVKLRAGYFQDGDPQKAILGVGYTDVPQDMQDVSPHESIISGEWTFGAINLCCVLSAQYAKKYETTKDNKYQQWSQDLAQDAENMTNATRYLLLDTSRNDQDINAYYYANRRYFIPFGWYANRIDSLTSTAWAVMVNRNFNPFVLGGAYDKSPIDPDSTIPQVFTTQSSQQNSLLFMTKLGIPQDQQKRLNFLIVNNTSDRESKKAPFASQTGLPLSFYAPDDFWNNLVTNNLDYAKNEQSIEAITERVLTHYGLDIYDAATMQIAFAIFPQFKAGMAVAKAQTQRLLASSTIPSNNSSIRGWTRLDQPDTQRFYYGSDKKPIYPENRDNTSPGAYYFRSISDQYYLTDPLSGETQYANGQKVEGSEKIHWTDWKPITGENAWAALIGPLQIAFAEYGNLPSLDSDAVQLALNVLDTYEVMASRDGGLFYAPWNMAGNESGTIADALSLSNENNFSSYAGLQMLKVILEAGGETKHLPTVTRLLDGLDNYFQNFLYDKNNKVFFTSGTYNNPLNEFIPGGQLFKFSSNDFSALIVALEHKNVADFRQHLYTKFPLSSDISISEAQPNTKWNLNDSSQHTLVTITLTMSDNVRTLSFNGDKGQELFQLSSNDVQTLVTALTNSNAATIQSYFQRITDFPLSTNLTITSIPVDSNSQINKWEIFDTQNQHTLIAMSETKAGITTISFYSAYMAVDVHTWGCTVLGVEKVDTWFKEQNVTAYSLWQNIKQRAGYFQDNDSTKILGVGYTDVPTGNHQSIISAEWTFGAINMCLVLAEQYSQETSEHYHPDWAKALRNDANSMYEGVKSLLLDTKSMSDDTEAYYYANTRYAIPFGWYANQIDSLCATAWSIMIDNNFNPFMLGGSYTNQVTYNHGLAQIDLAQPLLQLKNIRLSLESIQDEGNQ